MADPTDESGTGPLLKNRYRLGRVLGRGGMCIVYQAWDTKLQRDVAVKRLEPPLNQDPRTRARFDREGRALAQLSHPERGHAHRSGLHRDRRLPGVRVRRGPLAQGDDQGEAPGCRRGGPHPGAGGRGTGRRSPGGHRPPRRQAAEHPHRPAGPRQDHRLRHRDRTRLDPGHQGGLHHRQRPLHVARSR